MNLPGVAKKGRNGLTARSGDVALECKTESECINPSAKLLNLLILSGLLVFFLTLRGQDS